MKRTIMLAAVMLAASISLSNCVQASAEEAPRVKNIIYMIGDGMGLAHVSMLEIEERFTPTAFDRAQNIALISTYSANNRVTDSAASGTALATGSKTNNSYLGVDPDGNPLESIIAKAQKAGLATGLVVTSTILHATPGAFYAHVDNRNYEEQIAADLLQSDIDVVIGGGRDILKNKPDEGESFAERLAGKGYTVVEELAEADDIHEGKLIGICGDHHMVSMLNGRGDYLKQATEKALEILSANAAKSGKGLILMVEGSQIDMEAHSNNSEGILAEMRDFERAVGAAMDFADRNPGTLVVVCADHETSGMSIPSNKKDFTESESGIKYVYGTGSHTGIHVPVYLYGTGAELINGIMDNTDLSRRLQEILLN